MSGTLITYQGHVARSVVFRRSRGWRADASQVVFAVEDFPAGFTFRVPNGAAELLRRGEPPTPDLGALRTGRRPPAPERKRSLDWSGYLVLAEVQGGEEWTTVVGPLFVARVDQAREGAGSRATVAVTLVDERHLWAWGYARRWSFNRRRGDGTLAADSLKPTAEGPALTAGAGRPYTTAEIAQELAAQLPLGPSLVRTPPEWEEPNPGTELPPFAPAGPSLAALAVDLGLEEPCLGYDGSVSLWGGGEGRVGYAESGLGGENNRDLPAELRVGLGGTGQGLAVEHGYPEPFLLVVGGHRIRTVAVEPWEPVLQVGGRVVPLTEEVVRGLTLGAHGLLWLRSFVLDPDSYQASAGLDRATATLLREQAWRLFRLPFAVNEDDGSPGPNAHLLPLLPRAETQGGRRLPAEASYARFTAVHRTIAPAESSSSIRLAAIRLRLVGLRNEIRSAVVPLSPATDPWSNDFGREGVTRALDFIGFDREPEVGAAEALSHGLGDGGGFSEALGEDARWALGQALLLERLARLPSGIAALGQEYTALVREQGELERGEGTSALLALAIEAQALGREIQEHQRSIEVAVFGGGILQPREAEQRRAFAVRAQALRRRMREAEHAIEERRRATRTGPRAPQTLTVLLNVPRAIDPGASIVDAAAGVIRTSALAGTLHSEEVPTPGATILDPAPVLVLFGAVVRPRTDRAAGRPLTGAVPQGWGPHAADDRETFYARAFRRVAPGQVERVDERAIPPGAAAVIRRPDLVELLPLDGAGNVVELDQQAETIAVARSNRRDLISEKRATVARPWPVLCDGLVAEVEIRSRESQGAPCGFLTSVTIGSRAAPRNPFVGRTRTRGDPFAGAADARTREGL